MMQFAVDAWEPDYGAGGDSTHLDKTEGMVDVGVELGAAEWEPVDPGAVDPPESVMFVDGVRRIDARLWITSADGLVHPGVCASFAAGAVVARGGEASVEAIKVGRGLFALAGEGLGPIVTKDVTYALYPVADDSSEGLYLGVHEQMTALELSIESDGIDLVVFDGPLRGRQSATAVGYVKTHHVQYLPEDQQRVVYRLAPGQRSPLFLVGGQGFSRWSWYVRLPGPITHPLAGVVRCELAGLGTVDDAAWRASLVTATLGRFASEPHKDGRAPQNLYPIAGLERELQRRLGDRVFLERGLRLAASG